MLGVNVAIVSEGRVLLTLREDFEVWCLPGGQVEPGESLDEAAHREVREEIGVDIRIERLVGMYARPRWLDGSYHVALFTAELADGNLVLQGDEVLDAQYVDVSALPSELLLGQRRRIMDAVSGGRGITHSSGATYPFDDREAALRARDASSLSRSAFYATHIARPNAQHEAP